MSEEQQQQRQRTSIEVVEEIPLDNLPLPVASATLPATTGLNDGSVLRKLEMIFSSKRNVFLLRMVFWILVVSVVVSLFLSDTAYNDLSVIQSLLLSLVLVPFVGLVIAYCIHWEVFVIQAKKKLGNLQVEPGSTHLTQQSMIDKYSFYVDCLTLLQLSLAFVGITITYLWQALYVEFKSGEDKIDVTVLIFSWIGCILIGFSLVMEIFLFKLRRESTIISYLCRMIKKTTVGKIAKKKVKNDQWICLGTPQEVAMEEGRLEVAEKEPEDTSCAVTEKHETKEEEEGFEQENYYSRTIPQPSINDQFMEL